MNDEYYEQFEPMPEQLEAIQQYVSDYAKSIAKELVENNEHLKNQCKELLEKNKEIPKLKKIVSDLEIALENKYNEFSKNCAIQYLAKEAGIEGVNYGDTLYVVDCERHSEKCTECNGEKMVSATYNNGKLQIKCPKCHGGHAYTFHKYYIKEVRVVGFSVSAKENLDTGCAFLRTTLTLSSGEKDKYGDTKARNYQPENLNSSNYYSAWYKTKEDAVKYCEKELQD